jgi:hypothetical protein
VAKNRIDINHQGQLGVAWVQWIVEGLWNAGMEVISAHNDDGIDVLILLKRRKKTAYAGPTGDVIFAQIKTGYVTEKPTRDYKINLKKEYLSDHIPRWLSYPGPVIIINVIPPRHTKGTPEAYWANLRSDCYNEDTGVVSFKFDQKFDGNAKSKFFDLCWRWAEFRQLPIIRAEAELPFQFEEVNLKYISKKSDNAFVNAKLYYSNWKSFYDKNPGEFSAKITWRGWKHMTRFSRPSSTKYQSLQLLPVAFRMLMVNRSLVRKKLTKKENQRLPCGQTRVRWYEGITSRVTFYERHEAVITLIIECTELTLGGVVKHKEECFYSLYEVARRKSFS